MVNDANAFLTSTGAPSADFSKVGNKVTGFILDFRLADQTEFGTGKVKTFDNGDPMKQIVITLQTMEQDDDEDDGTRRVYAKGQMLTAIRQALGPNGKDSIRAGLAIGGKLAVQYVADGEKKKGLNPPKQYRAWYEPPKEGAQLVAAGGATSAPDDDDPFAGLVE